MFSQTRSKTYVLIRNKMSIFSTPMNEDFYPKNKAPNFSVKVRLKITARVQFSIFELSTELKRPFKHNIYKQTL